MGDRIPCPMRIVDDLGGAYGMGAVGGSVWYGFKGIKNSPKGLGSRMTGALTEIKLRAPTLGGNFAAWGGLYCTFDCSLQAIRGVDDPINSITSGGLTGAALALRGGAKAMIRSGLVGAVILGLIEGVTYALGRTQETSGPKPVLPAGPAPMGGRPGMPPPPPAYVQSSAPAPEQQQTPSQYASEFAQEGSVFVDDDKM
eukprot:TRINITY_DN2446_c1_g1_i3.p1 TRINITY_DN2446_c1_g1~~TRINITY_DN2446_c1_g1_i3.p1  ORF type:complete len:217 (+),score=46.64 TRINITY_DN2446_c1_g1_i3:57-653(+)